MNILHQMDFSVISADMYQIFYYYNTLFRLTAET